MDEPTRDDAANELPLKPQWFHILLALSEEPLHGSGIVRSILTQTDGRMRLWPAMLYGSLDELAGRGWIEEVLDPQERPQGVSDRQRIYRITGAGVRLLAAEAERLAALARAALSRVGGGLAT